MLERMHGRHPVLHRVSVQQRSHALVDAVERSTGRHGCVHAIHVVGRVRHIDGAIDETAPGITGGDLAIGADGHRHRVAIRRAARVDARNRSEGGRPVPHRAQAHVERASIAAARVSTTRRAGGVVIDHHGRRAVVRAVREVEAVVHVPAEGGVEVVARHRDLAAPHASIRGHPGTVTIGPRQRDDRRSLAGRSGNDAAFPDAGRCRGRRWWRGRAGAGRGARIPAATPPQAVNARLAAMSVNAGSREALKSFMSSLRQM